MIPSYHRPASVADALRLKAELGPGAVYLAGGTEVNNLHSPRPSALIDLAGLGLGTVEVTAQGTRLGACVSFQQLVEHPGIQSYLKAAAGQMTNRNIRNLATVGGQLGANRSCADLIPTLLAADARVTLADRELPIEAYLQGEPGLILSVFVPASSRGFGQFNQTRTASDLSIINVAVSLGLEGERVLKPIVAMGGVARHVVRLRPVEDVLDGNPLPPAESIEPLIARAVDPIDDLRGSAAYKRHLASVLCGRALRAAVRDHLSGKGVQ